MSRVEAAAAMDRLPWLPDEPAPQPVKRRRGGTLVAVSAAILLTAGAAFWFGARGVDEVLPTPHARHAQPATTVRLPAPRLAPPPPALVLPRAPEIRVTPVPEVHVSRVPEVHIAAPVERRESREFRESAPAPATPAARTAPVAAQRVVPPRPHPTQLRPWPPRVVSGAAGRLVQIGAFGSPHQAKLGWWYMVRAYPAVAHLPALVTETDNSRGRAFYRFQVGTTSQAHSEVLCQRMHKIHFSCAVVGLPWKATVER